MGPHKVNETSFPSSTIGNGGYEITNRMTLFTKNGSIRPNDTEALKCGICSKILREPMQLITCGCRYCASCINDFTSSQSEPFTCPIEGESFTRNDIRKDKGCMKEIQQLKVNCSHCSKWRGLLVSLEQHLLEECPGVTIPCPKGCGADYVRAREVEHRAECSKRDEECEHCHEVCPKDQMFDHLASCPHCPVTCDYCNKHLSKRSEYETHLEVECTEWELTCSMPGCNFKGKREVMSQHAVTSHLLSFMEKTSQLSVRVSTLESTNETLQKQLKEKDKKIEKLDAKVEKLEEKLMKAEQLIQSSFIQSDDIARDGPTHSYADTHGYSAQRGIGTLDSKTSVRKSPPSYTPRHEEDQLFDKTSSSALTYQLRESVEKHDNQLARLHESMQSLQQNITHYSIAVDELKLRQDVLDVKTTNGIFIWKIPDIRRRYRDALDRKTISLYSPPFHTSPHGYRMCIRVYLNGDGSGKGTYVSLFFVLMRSEHDSLLSFPFKQSVRFTLINQENRAESVTEAFTPDLRSQSFQRPEADMNVASGFPKFARQTVLQDEKFTKGNTIYIKAQVDLAGLALE